MWCDPFGMPVVLLLLRCYYRRRALLPKRGIHRVSYLINVNRGEGIRVHLRQPPGGTAEPSSIYTYY